MRIAIIETAAFGGLLHYAVQLGDGLAERGHEVDLLTPSDNELVDHRGAARMRPILAAPSRPEHALPKSPIRRFVKRAGVALRLVAAWLRIIRESRRGRYDVMLIDCDVEVSVAAVGALTLVSLPGRPKIAMVAHNAKMVDRSGRTDGLVAAPPLLTAVLRRMHSRIDLHLVHGERSKHEFEDTWPHRSVATIPHGDEGIFAAEPPPPAAEQRVLMFGLWNRVKGIPVLMEAFDLLAARAPEARLTMAGMPQAHEVDVEAIERWAAGHDGRVELIPRYVAMEEVPELFGRARVVAVPYVLGYQSGVVHVAMTMARAVVASDVGDLGAAVNDGETGVLVPPGDPESLAGALERVLADPELANRLGAAGRERMLADSNWGEVAALAEAAMLPLVGGRS